MCFDSTNKLVLVIDDDIMICRMLNRELNKYFDKVITARSPNEAEHLLLEYEVTHMVCDYHFGDGVPSGVDFIPAWRNLYTGLEKVVLFTGSDRARVKIPPEVDAVVNKGEDLDKLLSALFVA